MVVGYHHPTHNGKAIFDNPTPPRSGTCQIVEEQLVLQNDSIN